MQIEKVRTYPVPQYPTAVQFHNRERVTHYLPRRWRCHRLVGQVLVFTALSGLCSCSLADPGGERETVPAETREAPEADLSVPLFVHGAGRGSYGCVSVVPPVYLSEDEAAQVIRETALEYGVDFSGTGTVQSEELPYTNLYTADPAGTYSGTLTLDGYDTDRQLGFEYVSAKDVTEWQKDLGVYSTVSTMDMQGTARRLTEAVQNTAVFYDPGVDFAQIPDWGAEEDWDRAVEEYCAAQKERMTADLRAQVVDFMEWLRGQGILE